MAENMKVGIKALFARMDVNGDGFLDQEEFQSVLGQVLHGHLTEDEISVLMEKLDKDGDGRLAYSEFLDWLFNVEVRGGKGYLEKYALREFTVQLLERLKEEEPDDPYNIICEEATSWRVQWKEINRKADSENFKRKSTASLSKASSMTFQWNEYQLSAEKWNEEQLQKLEALKALSESVSELLQRSTDIKNSVINEMYKNESPWQQDIIYRGAGLEDLLDDAKLVKPVFDDLCKSIVVAIQEKEQLGPGTYFSAVEIKGYNRAEAKTRVSYLNDASQLTDVVRGTIVLDLPVEAAEKPLEIGETVYDILEFILEYAKDAKGSHLVHFDDRYQRPLGNYRDFLFLVKVHGYICELQINFDVAIKLKEGSQHTEFELKRLANDLLLEATMTKNMPKLKIAIDGGASVRVHDKINRLTALHYAAASGDDEMTRCLLENGADPLATDIEGYLPINRPLVKQDITVSQTLLEYMLNEECMPRYSSLHDAAQLALVVALERATKNGMTEQMESLSELLKAVFASRGLRLFFSVRGHAATAVRLLIEEVEKEMEEGLCPDFAINKLLNGWFMYRSDVPRGDCTLLDEAVLSGNRRIAAILAGKGAQFHPHGPHDIPQKAAMYYAQHNQAERLEALLHVDQQAPRHLDIVDDDPNWFSIMDNPSNCVEDEGGDGRKRVGGPWGEVPGTPLNVNKLVAAAVERQSFKALSILLEGGNKLPDDDVEGGPALRAAAGIGDEDAVRLLLLAGAKIDDRDRNDRTALWISAAGGHVNVVSLLCSAEADVNIVDRSGKSALAIAAMNLQLDCVQAICDVGADFDQMPKDRKCHPGCIAAANGSLLILKALHGGGMDLSRPLEDQKGWTIAHSAAKHSQGKVLEFLEEKGIDVRQESVLEKARSSQFQHQRPEALQFLEHAGPHADKPAGLSRSYTVWTQFLEQSD